MSIVLVYYKTVGIPEYDESDTFITGYNHIREGYELMTLEDYESYEPDGETMDKFNKVATLSIPEAYNLKDQLQHILDTMPLK